jgi:hypothetical protein
MLTPETSAAEVKGHWIIGPKGTSWHDGPGLLAWRTGARLVIDEIDQAGGDTIPVLHALLDDDEVAEITPASGGRVTPKEGFSAFCTMNSDPLALPQALADRFVTKLHIEYPSPDVLETLPVILRPAASYALYGQAGRHGMTSAHNLKSTRTWIEIGRLLRGGLSLGDALRVVSVNDRDERAVNSIATAQALTKA